jgi:putative heme-binding domain-containing protein
LNGEGGVLGPDLSGSARDNLGYLLDNLLFPGAIVADDFRLTTLSLKDGRTLAGMVRSRATRTLKLQTMTELIALSVDEIVKEETSAASLMPPGLLDGLSTEDARDLIAYLMAK